MSGRWDPIQRRDDGSMDLQDVVEWEPRSLADRLVYRLYGLLLAAFRGLLVVAAVAILGAQFALGGLGALADPVVGTFVILSAVPALILAVYIRYADVTPTEPLRLLVVTFALGLLFAGFAGVLNTALAGRLGGLLSLAGLSPELILPAIFFLVVGPVEEAVKLLAVRLYAYRRPEFDAVVVGAVYGAAAGLGFATIENAIYITRVADATATFGLSVAEGGAIATQRALAGPGHVIYSAFAGYYLGLAKFNREYAGPIVLKGLLIAAFIHASYNTLVSTVPGYLTALFGLSDFVALFAFIIAYDGLFTFLLVRKLSKYRAAYRRAHAGQRRQIPSERTEFE
jgi:RsiW-degrading membrane proteinase PrsW (M82 family)